MNRRNANSRRHALIQNAAAAAARCEALESRKLFSADLAPIFASLLPSAVQPSGKNKVTVSVANIGDAPNVGGVDVALYASQDTTYDSFDTLITSGRKLGTLAVGRAAAVKLSFTAPATLPDGNYYLIAHAAPTFGADGNLANDDAVSFNLVQIKQPFVDLRATVPPLPAGPLVITPKLKPIKGSILLTNNGNVPAAGVATVTLLASLDPVADSSDIVLPGFGKAIKLKAGATKPLKAKITVPQSIPSGSYYLLADVAFAGAIAESNPADNAGASANAVAIFNPSTPAPTPTPTPTPTPSPTPTPTPTPTPSPTATSLAVASGGSTIADDQAAPVAFEPAVQGQAAAARTFTVTNDGTGTLTLGSLVLPEGFALQEPLAFALAPNESDSFSVALDTTQPGTFGGAVSLTTNVPGHETFDFPVGGAVTAPSQPTLGSQLVINRNTIFIGDPKTVAFHANVAASSAGVAVAVYEVDATGTDVGKVVDLFDDGSASHGDSVAGDGVFNNTTAVSFDAPGSRRFVARMGTDVAGQTPVVVVTGTTAPTDAELQAASDGAASVRQQVDAAIAGGQPVITALAEARARLESDPTLAKPGSIDATRNGLAWESPQGFICYIDADELTGTEKCSDPAGTATATAMAIAPSATASAAHVHPSIASPAGFVGPTAIVNPASVNPATAGPASVGPAAFVGPADSCKKAIAISPFYYQFGQYDDYEPAVNILSTNGWRVETVTNPTSADNNVTPDTFKGLDKYNAVSISSHGETFSQYKTMINTGCLDTPASRAQYASDLANHLVSLANGRTLGVLPEFIYTYNTKFDGTIVYVGACKSAADGSLANAFRNRGAAAFIGYTDNVEAPWASNRAASLWGTLVQPENNTLADVTGINTLKEPDRTPATFRAYGSLSTKLKGACEQLKDYDLVISYTWDQTQRDLDTSTGFLGASAGYSCGSGSDYLKWDGDITTAGGTETITVDLNAAYVAAQWQGTTSVSLAAGWYAPSNGKGSAQVTALLKQKTTGEERQVQLPQEINPGSQSGCASGSPAGSVNVFAEGDPLDPAVRIVLMAN